MARDPRLYCAKHDRAFVRYDDGLLGTSWARRHRDDRFACPVCLESFRAFCREINVRPKDRPLFHGLRAS